MLCLKLRYFMESQSNYNSFVRTYPPEIIKNQRILKCGGIYLCTGIYFFKLASKNLSSIFIERVSILSIMLIIKTSLYVQILEFDILLHNQSTRNSMNQLSYIIQYFFHNHLFLGSYFLILAY